MSLPKKASASVIAAPGLGLVPRVDDGHGAGGLDDPREALRLDGRMEDELHGQGSFVGPGAGDGATPAGAAGRAGRRRRRGSGGSRGGPPRPPRAVRPGEDEAQVAASPPGSGTSSWPTWALIVTSSMPGTASAASRPRVARSTPPRGIGIIMTPAGRRSRSSESRSIAERVAEDSSSRDTPGPEAERARAEAADRAGGDLDHPRTLVVDPQLGVDRPLREAERPRRPARLGGDRGLASGRQARGRHVERLLEVRPVERVGLVEERQHVELSRHQEPLQRHLAPGNEVLDQHLVAPRPPASPCRRLEDRRDPPERGDEGGPDRRPGSRRGCRRGSSA